MRRKQIVDAVLSVDGNEGFAMIGDGWEIGPAEFEPVQSSESPGSDAWNHAARRASERALERLQRRFPERVIRGAWQAPG